MPLFSRFSSGSSTTSQTHGNHHSQTQASQRSRIQTVITERDEPYVGEPQDMGTPAFTRTGSYYLTGVDQREYKYLQASDVRRQVQQAPAAHQSVGIYPRQYHNQPPQPLRSQPPRTEFPIVPSPQNGSAPSNYRGGNPGPARAFYNNNDRSRFDVGYHDSNRAPVGPRNGRAHVNTPYSLASYHPAPTYTDTSTGRRS